MNFRITSWNCIHVIATM